MHPRKFSKHVQHDRIVAAIHEAEHKTSGQIRVSISPNHVEEPVVAAQAEFLRLGMEKTPERNGVLIFVAPRSHKFAVIGDEAVHAKCGDEFWRKLGTSWPATFANPNSRRASFTAYKKPANCWRNIFRADIDDAGFEFPIPEIDDDRTCHSTGDGASTGAPRPVRFHRDVRPGPDLCVPHHGQRDAQSLFLRAAARTFII